MKIAVLGTGVVGQAALSAARRSTCRGTTNAVNAFAYEFTMFRDESDDSDGTACSLAKRISGLVTP